jgi:hypothetical protein
MTSFVKLGLTAFSNPGDKKRRASELRHAMAELMHLGRLDEPRAAPDGERHLDL